MLAVDIVLSEGFDDDLDQFVVLDSFKLQLEHSLLSLSKWEEKFEKPFLSADEKTSEETLYYYQCMTLNEDPPPGIYFKLTEAQVEEITAYLNAKMSATWFREIAGGQKPGSANQVITAELIYHMMSAHNIGLEWENRHLNKLITLIRVHNEKNAAPKKMKPADAAAERHRIVAERRAQAEKERLEREGSNAS